MHEVLEDGEERGVAAAGVEEFGVELDAEDAFALPGFHYTIRGTRDHNYPRSRLFYGLVME